MLANSVNKQKLKVLCLDESLKSLYSDHKQSYTGDSGVNLFTSTDVTVKKGETQLIPLGIKAAAYSKYDHNVSFLILSRSSMSKTPLRLSNSIGLIDSGYRGELKICVDNIKDYDYNVPSGSALVQAVFFNGKPFDIEIVDKLEITERDENGWGSTNVNT